MYGINYLDTNSAESKFKMEEKKLILQRPFVSWILIMDYILAKASINILVAKKLGYKKKMYGNSLFLGF